MDYDFNRRITINTNSFYLQELDENNEVIDDITYQPAELSAIEFLIENIEYTKRIKSWRYKDEKEKVFGPYFMDNISYSSKKLKGEVIQVKRILAKIKPINARYSFFGTDREIKDFYLELDIASDSEYYTSGANICKFPFYNNDDYLIFSLHVNTNTFNDIVELTYKNAINESKICLTGIKGLYNSNGIINHLFYEYDRNIKVLCYQNKKIVENIEGIEDNVQSLGLIDDFELFFIKNLSLIDNKDTDSHKDNESEFKDEATQKIEEFSNDKLGQEKAINKDVSGTKKSYNKFIAFIYIIIILTLATIHLSH